MVQFSVMRHLKKNKNYERSLQCQHIVITSKFSPHGTEHFSVSL